MSQSSLTFSPANQENVPGHATVFMKKYWLPLLAVLVLAISIGLMPERNPIRHDRTPMEWVAHYLGHGVNSAWVAISLLLLVLTLTLDTMEVKATRPLGMACSGRDFG